MDGPTFGVVFRDGVGDVWPVVRKSLEEMSATPAERSHIAICFPNFSPLEDPEMLEMGEIIIEGILPVLMTSFEYVCR